MRHVYLKYYVRANVENHSNARLQTFTRLDVLVEYANLMHYIRADVEDQYDARSQTSTQLDALVRYVKLIY